MKRFFPAATACVLVIVCGVVHGFWTDRWAAPVETAAAAARMEQLPMDLGDWSGQIVEDKNPTAGGTAGSIQRRYVNRKTGEAVNIYLVCGRPGPVATHTPEVCYAAGGYEVGAKSKADLYDGAAFWTADAVRRKATEESRIRLYWGWTAGAGWYAPDDARIAFHRAPVLFKLYVQRELAAAAPPVADEPCAAFLRVLLPALDRTLFTAES
jgi:hypothetical protein